MRFISNLNSQHPSIKIHLQSFQHIHRFPRHYCIHQEQKNSYVDFQKKPTDTQNYLHYKAEHPRTLKNSIPFGQILRIKRICSEAQEFLQNCKKMLDKFSERGYPKTTIQEAFCNSTAFQRENLLKIKKKKRSNRIPLVVTYNRTLPDLGAIINKHWNILQIDPKMKEKFSDRPILAYRRCKNLRDIIGSNKFSNNKVVRPRHDRGE